MTPHRTPPSAVPAGQRSTENPVLRAVRLLGAVVRAGVAAGVLGGLLVGVPYGLVRYVGWPLPDHVPSWNELQTTLLLPLSPRLLLDALACGLWPLWVRFATSVLAAIPATLHTPDRARPSLLRARAPLRSTARLLVGAVVFVLIHSRTANATTHSAPIATGAVRPDTVAAAPRTPGPDTADRSEGRLMVITAALHTTPVPQPQETVTVRAPEHGVHDSLWRIAVRCLGDGNRWPELWALNHNTTQPDGAVFTIPSAIRPGWQLQLPTTPAPAPAHHPSAPPSPERREAAQRSAVPPPGAPATSTTITAPAPPGRPSAAPPVTSPDRGASAPVGFTLPEGAYLGAGLAALITAAAITVRLRRRRDYHPGTRPTADPTAAPVVRALRLAHDTTTAHDPASADTSAGDHHSPAAPAAGSASADVTLRRRARAVGRGEPGTTVVGVRDGRPLALDIARRRGLGLIGDGAEGAARAVIITLLAEHDSAHDPATDPVGGEPVIVVPQAVFDRVLAADTPSPRPAGLRVVADLSSALDLVETELLHRTHHRDAALPVSGHGGSPARHYPPLVLLAAPHTESAPRLQAVLDNGSTLGLAGVLLGHWPAGATVRVGTDGTVTATSPTLAEDLAGARLFTLPANDTAELLTLLHATHPAPQHPPAETTTTPPNESDDTPTPRSVGGAGVPPRPPDTLDYDFSVTPPHQCPNDEPTPTNPAPTVREPRPAADTDNTPATTATTALHLQVLGRLGLRRAPEDTTDLIEGLAPRQRDILVYLALHRDGIRRAALTAALWPDAPGERPYNTLRATLSQLRRALAAADTTPAAVTVHQDGHDALDPAVITVDLWQLQDALAAHRRASTPAARITALDRISDLYRGELADGLCADWIDAPREALRREVLDTFSATIRDLRADHPEQSLLLLEQARLLDPYNEAIYRDIMRTQAHLHHDDSIPRTLALLTTALHDLDQHPRPDTLALAEQLRHPQSRPHKTTRTPP